jgi:hypothetical protein
LLICVHTKYIYTIQPVKYSLNESTENASPKFLIFVNP